MTGGFFFLQLRNERHSKDVMLSFKASPLIERGMSDVGCGYA